MINGPAEMLNLMAERWEQHIYNSITLITVSGGLEWGDFLVDVLHQPCMNVVASTGKKCLFCHKKKESIF